MSFVSLGLRMFCFNNKKQQQQKTKCVPLCLALDLVSSFVRVTRSPCYQFVGALFSALLGMLFDCPCPLSRLSPSFSCLVALLRLRCSRSGSLVLLWFSSSLWRSVHFSVLCTSAPWNCSPAVLWFCSNLPNSGRSAPVPGLLLIFRDWILGNPFL